MSTLVVRPGGALVGKVRLAGDLHIGQQALVWAALADGPSTLRNLGARRDHRILRDALAQLGARSEEIEGLVRVHGVGLRGLSLPRGALSAGDSETALELLVSLLAGQRFGTRVEATGPAAQRSLRTVLVPLRHRGAHVAGRLGDDEDLRAPVAVAPLLADEPLESVEIAIPTGDPATKLALLVSGLYTEGVTAVSEGMLSRDHVERALSALGAPIETAAGMTLLDTTGREAQLAWSGFDWTIPGDVTLTSHLVAAAMSVPGSDVVVEGVSLNPTRIAMLEALSGTGARVAITPKGDAAGYEPVGDLRAKSSRLSRVRVGGERALRLLDEVPALVALAPICTGRMSVRDVTPLRQRTPDALRETSSLLARFGIACTAYEDGLEIDPPGTLRGAHVPAEVPPAQALLAVVLGLTAEGATRIEDAERLDALYPGFCGTLAALGARIEREEA